MHSTSGIIQILQIDSEMEMPGFFLVITCSTSGAVLHRHCFPLNLLSVSIDEVPQYSGCAVLSLCRDRETSAPYKQGEVPVLHLSPF